MYPRNAASPERIAIGSVVLISDGTVQTSGVSVKVMPQGGAAGAGGGTVAYEEGIVHYLPTQAETNYTSFMLAAYKAACIPAAVTVVTSASATAGKVVLSGETHTSAVIPAVSTVTNLTNAPTSGDLTATMKTSIGTSVAASAVASVTGNVGGNVTGSVGSLATQAKADVNAEVLDVLATDTYAELAAVPAATSSIRDRLAWLFALARNKITQTGTTTTLRNDADAASIATSTTSDDATTGTRGEWT